MEFPQDIPFVLFACCLPVKGSNRSIICDVQRKKIRLIPNSLYEILVQHAGKPITEIKSNYEEKHHETIEAYFSALYEEEYIFFSDNYEQFPPMSMEWDEPNRITNSIIDVHSHSAHDWQDIIAQLESLYCKHVQVRVFSPITLDYIAEVMNACEEKLILSVEWLIPYFEGLTENSFSEIISLVKDYPRISFIVAHSAPESKAVFLTGADMGNIYLSKSVVDGPVHCGIIQPQKFSINVKAFTEATHYNSCLNRKISIDSKGQIKNCPSLTTSYGNIINTTLQEALEKPGFKKYWSINKDQISVCKDCEFRYICTDCRAYLEDPQDIYSKPLKCGYDPYTCEWEEWSTNPLKQEAIAHYGMQELVTLSRSNK